jgi:predicted house-cleaning noncanonical NTP pyrophosphatase (MazG superfamily)|tara:strand:+ start:101 stop:388 length:288 start_codon:yes stop_codon:yes gene_type:complete
MALYGKPQEEPVAETTEDRVEYYRKLARAVRDDGLKKILAAPVKSNYNKMFKQWDKTQRDYKAELASKLQTINEFCKDETGVSLEKEPELPNLNI